MNITTPAKFVREIHPIAKTLDSRAGIVEYVASDESLDRDGEILRAAGWRFTNFQKNAPFLDNHQYGSIGSVLGKVMDARVEGKQLVETVQWAIDVPENTLAQVGFKMTDAGYLKAVSIGGIPVKIAFNDGSRQFQDLVKSFGLPATAPVKRIFLEQEQLELSACSLGSNPNALAKAYREGIIPDSLVNQCPELARLLQKSPARSYSFPVPPPPPTHHDMTVETTFSSMFQILGRKSRRPSFDELESARRELPPESLAGAVNNNDLVLGEQGRAAFGDAIEKALADPAKRVYWNSMFRHLCGQKIPPSQLATIKALSDHARRYYNAEGAVINLPTVPKLRGAGSFNSDEIAKGLDTSPTGPGTAFFLGQEMAQDVFDLVLIYGAFRTLGLRKMSYQYTKFAQITALPTAVFIPPSTQTATPIAPDAAFTGASLLPEANYVSTLLPVSIQLYEDNAVDFSRLLLETLAKSIAATVDYACFQGNGNVDPTNGGQIGMFVDNTITTVSADATNVSIKTLIRDSFVNTVAAVSAAALQRPCNWWISPAFLPGLLTIKEGATYMLKTPSETGDGTWRILGFPVVWTAQAPSANTPGSKIAAFGNPDSYLVALREDFQMDSSAAPGWNTLQKYVRSYSRVWCQTREKHGLATLALAAN
jgi:HK97 family phage major capsid protein